MSEVDFTVMAYTEGYDDAYSGSGDNLNPFDDITQPDQWQAYENGFNNGINQLIEETA